MLVIIAEVILWPVIIWFTYLTLIYAKRDRQHLADLVRQHQIDEQNRQQTSQQLETSYKAALKGEDKALALELGRQYYAARRGGELTLQDEQALTNDIITMR